MAALAIQFGEKRAAASKLWCLGQVRVVTCAARSLYETGGQHGLLPRQCRFVSLGNFGGRALAAMADSATPVADIMRDLGVRTERLRDSRIRKARLRNSLVACGAAVHHIHSRQPDLVDLGAVVRNQFFCVRAGLRETQVQTLVLLPFAASSE